LKIQRYYIVLILLVWSAKVVNAQNDSVFSKTTIAKIALVDNQTGKKINLTHPRKKFLLFLFLSPECPLCQSYTGHLNNFNTTFGEDVVQYGIIPGKTYSTSIVQTFANNYHISFPLLTDPGKKLCNYLQASITPEAILLDTSGKLVYKGAIDDLLPGLGKRKLKATDHYLENALAEALNHQAITVKRVKAAGCNINEF